MRFAIRLQRLLVFEEVGCFDELITGSENKPVYNKVVGDRVISAVEGYNSVVFLPMDKPRPERPSIW